VPTKSQRREIVELAKKIELIEGLPRVIERKFRRLLKLAEADWERRFAGREPSDASVSVRADSGRNVIKKSSLPARGSHPKRVLVQKRKKRARRIRTS
jgi:hypothetical protein